MTGVRNGECDSHFLTAGSVVWLGHPVSLFLVTEPRGVAAVTMSQRVAYEMELSLRGIVHIQHKIL